MSAANKLVGDLSKTTPGVADLTPVFGYNSNTGQWVAHGAGGVAAGVTGSINSGHTNVKAVVIPTAAAFSGSNNTAVTLVGYDSAGKVTFTTPGTVIAGSQITVTFGTPFNTPIVTFAVQTSATNVCGPAFLTAVSGTAFTVGVNASTQLTASQSYTIYYNVVEAGAAS